MGCVSFLRSAALVMISKKNCTGLIDAGVLSHAMNPPTAFNGVWLVLHQASHLQFQQLVEDLSFRKLDYYRIIMKV